MTGFEILMGLIALGLACAVVWGQYQDMKDRDK